MRQTTHQLPNDSIKPRKKASTGKNAWFHIFWFKVYPLPRPSTTEKNFARTVLLNNHLFRYSIIRIDKILLEVE